MEGEGGEGERQGGGREEGMNEEMKGEERGREGGTEGMREDIEGSIRHECALASASNPLLMLKPQCFRALHYKKTD